MSLPLRQGEKFVFILGGAPWPRQRRTYLCTPLSTSLSVPVFSGIFQPQGQEVYLTHSPDEKNQGSQSFLWYCC